MGGGRAFFVALAVVSVAVGAALLFLDFPVSVNVWGTVANWFEAVGTGGAAIGAATFYVLDSRDKRAAQARLVGASLKVFADDNMAVTVQNDSDRPISSFQILYKEKSLAKALFAKEEFVVPQMRYYKPGKQVVKMLSHTSSPLKEIKTKAELLGYDGRAGLIVGWHDRQILGPGKQAYLSVDFVTSTPYRVSTEYWLIFTDANGHTWLRELRSSFNTPGRLRKSPANPMRLFPRRRGPKAGVRWLAEEVSHYWKVSLWLVRHRKERTSTEAELEVRHAKETKRLIAKNEPGSQQANVAESTNN